jgi:hypothetical protein
MFMKQKKDTVSVQQAEVVFGPGWWIVPSAIAGTWVWGWLAFSLIGS